VLGGCLECGVVIAALAVALVGLMLAILAIAWGVRRALGG
jgi:hypothetical protein